MNRLVLTLCSACCFVGLAASQNHTVFPSDHTGTGGQLTLQGNTYTQYVPFSYGIRRQMIIYDAWDVRIPNGRAISRIGFVRNGTSTATGYAVQMKVEMGQSTLPLDSVSTTFVQNFTTTPTVVFGDAQGGPKVFSLPDIGGATGVDVVWLPLDAPFTYDASKNLVIDFQIYANQNSNNAWPYTLDYAQHVSPVRSFNQACRTSGGLTPDIYSVDTSTYIGGTWYLRLRNGPATAATALLVGLSSYEPGLNLDVVGAPNCFLSISPEWAGAYTTSSSGAINWSFTIPMNRDLFGGRLYAQAVMNDVFANSLGWVTSNGDEIQLGIQPQARLLRGAQGDAQVATGSLVNDVGLITVFEHN